MIVSTAEAVSTCEFLTCARVMAWAPGGWLLGGA